ncbi:ABC transporter substrate-binding protein [Sodalis sp. RH15]|uniref:ABC transporter substrate-binding protein n=1 Tax=Sodalis sp. RH15 TaxID=3394330 RepID=UPI0039B5AA84
MGMTRRSFSKLLAGSMFLTTPLASMKLAFAAEPGVLTIAQGFDPVSLWPNFSTTQEQINAGNLVVEPLFWIEPTASRCVPVLAEKYEQMDPLKVKITLRKNILFSNGEKCDADAVMFSFQTFMNVTVTPAYGQYSQLMDKVEKVDDLTLILHMKFPYPALELALSQVFILPPKYWAQVGGADGFGAKPIGTGPFLLKEWVRDSRITFAANPHYWGEAPKGINSVVLRTVPDDMSRASSLLNGECDIATNVPIMAAAQIKNQNGLSLQEVPSYRIFTLDLSSLPNQKSPVQDRRVRQALNYAVDKKGIIDGLFQGNARLLHGQLLRANELGYNPHLDDYPFDPKKARQLLAEAGYPNGFQIDFKFPTGRYAQDKEVAEAIAGMFADVGVKTNMISLEPGEFLRQLSNRELQPIGLVGLAPGDDPDLQMAQYRSDWRYSYVDNPQLDKLINAGAHETDRGKRAEIYQQASQVMFDDASVLYLYQATDLYGVAGRIKGFTPRGDQRWVITGMSIG